MDRWVNRLLDEGENEIRSRTCLIADYVRCLRVLGFSHPALEAVWRQLSLTMDPLASPDQAVAQLRRFVDAAEANLGVIPEDFPRVDFVQSLNQEEVRMARSMWGDRMLRAVFDLGTRRSVFPGADHSDEPHSEPPSGLDVIPERPVDSLDNVVTTGTDGHGHEQGQEVGAPSASASGVIASGSGTELVVRKVQVKTASCDLGQCLVHVSQVDDGNVVFAQVVEYLKSFCEKPPRPQAIFIGDSPDTGEYIDKKDVFVHLFDEAEVPTIWCVDEPLQGGDTRLTGVGHTPALCLQVLREHGLLASGDLREWPQREVVVKSALRDLGTCVVAIPNGATPLTVFCQVSAYLGQAHRIPPLPRWAFVGEDRFSGMPLDLDAALVDQVLETEQISVECLEQGFGLSKLSGEFGSGQPRKRRKKRRATSRGGDSGTKLDSQGLVDGPSKPRRHGWDAPGTGFAGRESGWDKPPSEGPIPPPWVVELITDIAGSIAPASLKTEADDVETHTGLRAGSLQGLSNLGQQSIVRFLNFVGNAEVVTLQAKLATGGEVVVEMGTVRNEISVVVHRLAREVGREVIKFGSPDIGGWNLVAQDVFEVPTGQVVVALVTQVDGEPKMIRHKNLRPRTPSRSPRRKNSDPSRRKVFGARPPLPVSRHTMLVVRSKCKVSMMED